MNVLGKVFTPRSQEDDPARSSASWLAKGQRLPSQTQSPRRATTPAPWGGEWSPYGDDPDPRSCSGGEAGPWRRPQPLGDGDA